MSFVIGLAGLALIAVMLVDAFETVLLPRRVTHGYRLIRLFYQDSWHIWRQLARLFTSPRLRESFLSFFGPLSVLVVFGAWAFGLVVGFALLHWSLHTPLTATVAGQSAFSYGYFSGDTFFTLGYGDLTPLSPLGKVLAILEAGLGFGFLALIISYHPVLTQAFSRRETTISLLDARGGSPPTASQILLRARQSGREDAINSFLIEWEHWSAELLESCLSFPMLAYYRSQHDNQSWLAALTAILDTCALEICGSSCAGRYQARLTFAIARHAAVDLSLVFRIDPLAPEPNRLTEAHFEQLKESFKSEGMTFPDGPATVAQLAELRAMYEPFVNGLAQHFLFKLPGFFPEQLKADNWQTSAWMPRTPGIRDLQSLERGDHFV
jgi:Ion channel